MEGENATKYIKTTLQKSNQQLALSEGHLNKMGKWQAKAPCPKPPNSLQPSPIAADAAHLSFVPHLRKAPLLRERLDQARPTSINQEPMIDHDRPPREQPVGHAWIRLLEIVVSGIQRTFKKCLMHFSC